MLECSPLVAIHCLVYNHEPYLRDCFEGFVMQQTNFPFVAIVHDDASTDGSAAIIREYEEKYPHIFKPIYEIENQYSKRDGSLDRIMDEAINATGAKYVAMCEGDDYWTDPLKLQKQVDFMEANPNYALCFHKVKTLIQDSRNIEEEFLVRNVLGTSTILDLAKGNYIHTLSVLYRIYPSVFERYSKIAPCLPGDYAMWILLAEKGEIFKLDEVMGVYRQGSGIWSSSHSIRNDVAYLCTLSKLYATIGNEQAKMCLREQIHKILDSIMFFENELIRTKKSRAYRLGKILLRPFKWLRK